MNYLQTLMLARTRQCFLDPRACFSVTLLPVTREDDGAGDAGEGGEGGNGGETKLLPQDEVNKILAKERRKSEAKISAIQDELKKYKEGGLSATERQELEEKLDKARRGLMSAEERAKEDARKRARETEEAIANAKKDAEGWKSRFTHNKVQTDLMRAASSPDVKAHNPDLLVGILKNNTSVEEELDESGRPNGNFVTKVSFETVNEEGKTVVLSLAPAEAVKRMKDDTAKYGSLFASTQKGGFNGADHGGRRGSINLETQEDYMKARKEGKHKTIGA